MNEFGKGNSEKAAKGIKGIFHPCGELDEEVCPNLGAKKERTEMHSGCCACAG